MKNSLWLGLDTNQRVCVCVCVHSLTRRANKTKQQNKTISLSQEENLSHSLTTNAVWVDARQKMMTRAKEEEERQLCNANKPRERHTDTQNTRNTRHSAAGLAREGAVSRGGALAPPVSEGRPCHRSGPWGSLKKLRRLRCVRACVRVCVCARVLKFVFRTTLAMPFKFFFRARH